MEDSKEIADQVSYLEYLQGVLDTEKEIPSWPEHAANEIAIQNNPLCLIACTIKMPPRIQALRQEDARLNAAMIKLLREQGCTGTKAHNNLLSSLELVREIMADWFQEEIVKSSNFMVTELPEKGKVTCVIGKDWHMLVVIRP